MTRERIIRQLLEADIERAVVVLEAAFGPSTWQSGLRRYRALQPDGLLLAEQDGQVVGVVGALDYGPFAYIGSLAVHPLAQRRGVARALMERLLAWLAGRGCPAVLLDATLSGAALYEQLGFADLGRSYLAARADIPDARPEPEGVMRAGAEDLEALAAFDAPIFGASRRGALALLLAEHAGRVFLSRDAAGALDGYVVAQSRSIGPWAARGPAQAERLLRGALTCAFEQPPRIFVPAGNPAVLALIEPYGFVAQRELRYMQHGRAPRPGDQSQLYGLLSFALG